MLDNLLDKWHNQFGSSNPAVMVRSPGRVNIIGEHTDYNEGWVLPGAISRAIYILVSTSEKNHWIASDLDEEYEDQYLRPEETKPLWVNYIKGTLQLYDVGDQSFRILIGGDLPMGAGVSASSSLVCGLLYALQKIKGGNETREELALIGSRVEREMIGLHGGIMDQFAIMLSQDKQAMLLDCRTRKYKFISAEMPGNKWVLINTKVRHQLINSDYNSRFDECNLAVVVIQKIFPLVKSLRDVTLEMLTQVKLDDVLFKRSKFVIEENERVHDMVKALETHDLQRAGSLLKMSHEGLRDEYEVSCEELDHLADFVNNHDGAYGGRMMGGGFGGCVICLVEEESIHTFLSEARASYLSRFGFDPEVINFELSEGVEYA